MIEIMERNHWAPEHPSYPLKISDDMALLEVRDKREGSLRLFLIGPREHLDLEKLVRKMLKAHYNSSGYAVRNLSLQQPPMGGQHYAAIRTMDHIDTEIIHTPEHADRLLSECVVVWESADFYFDIEE